MKSLLSRARARWTGAARRRHDASALARLSPHLLRDMGLEPGGFRALDLALRGR